MSSVWSSEGSQLENAFKDLLNIIPKGRWDEFAIKYLRVDEAILKQIKQQYHHDGEAQKMTICQKWVEYFKEAATMGYLQIVVNNFLSLDDPEANGRDGPLKNPMALNTDGLLNEIVAEVVTDAKNVASKVFSQKTNPSKHSDDFKKPENVKKCMWDKKNFCFQVTEGLKIKLASENNYKNHLNDEDVYRINRMPKGRVLILNNFFTGEKKERKGAEFDVNNMEDLWKGLGCELLGGKAQCDKTASQMIKLLEEMASSSRNYNFLVIVVMSHAVRIENEIFISGSDHRKLQEKSITSLFGNDNEHVRNIPKIFILQYCRGRDIEKGVVTSDCVETDGPVRVRVLPKVSDVLIAYPSHEKFAAIRQSNGSWFINAIVNIFARYAAVDHVVDLFTRVNKAMNEMTGEKDGQPSKAMSYFSSSLTKKLYLFPGFPK